MKTKILFLSLLILVSAGGAFAQTNARMLSTPNAQTGTTYTFAAADTTRVVTFNNASPVAVTLPNGATAGFGGGTMLSVVNLGAGQVTITCSSCTITANGVAAATLPLSQGQGADIYGGAGSPAVNYIALPSPTGGGPFSVSNLTVSGTGTFANINGVIYVGGSVPQVGGSADMGAQINAAYALLPATGGTINVIAQASGACYNYSTPIVLATSGKYVLLEGIQPTTGINSGGACLNYTPTTATTALAIDWTPSIGGNFAPAGGLKNIEIINNGCATLGGCASSATGISFGATNGGAEFGNFTNVSVSGFGTGVKCAGTNASVGYGMVWINHTSKFNTTGWAPGAGCGQEEIHFIGGMFAENGTGFADTSASQVSFIGTAFDTNSTAGLTCSAGGMFSFTNPHFENNGGTTTHYINCSNGNVTISGGTASDDVAVGNIDYWFTVSSIDVKGLNLFSAGRTVTGLFVIGTQSNISVTIGSPATLTLATLGAAVTGNGIWQVTTANSVTQPATMGITGIFRSTQTISDRGNVCTNGELALSAGWQSTGSATVTAVKGNGQTCEWTITTGTTTAANPTVTDTLTNVLPNATTVCEMIITGGNRTPAAGDGFDQTTLSATAPVFTFQGTPTAGGKTYQVVRRCGP